MGLAKMPPLCPFFPAGMNLVDLWIWHLVCSRLSAAGEYIDPLGHCQFCDPSCPKCIGPEACTACESTRVLEDGRCVLQCPKGKFEFQDQCHPCHQTCMECSGSEPNECTACGKDKKGNALFLHLGECTESCPLGYYPSENGHKCMPCFEHCEVCLDQASCERCFQGYYLADRSCQRHKCRKGEIEDPDSEVCIPCADGCLSCNSDDPRTCTSCLHNYYMYNQKCYRSCPPNTYNDENSLLCIECQPNCRSCDKYECYWCKEGFFLQDGTCVSDCGAGFYGDKVTEECEACPRTCAACKGYNDCTSCRGTLQLLHGKCVNPKSKQGSGKFWNERLKLHLPSGLAPAYLKNRHFFRAPSRSLQSSENDLLMVPSVHQIQTEKALQEAFSVAAPDLWKPFPLEARQNPSLSLIRKRSTATQFQQCDPSCKTCGKAADICTSCPQGMFLFSESCVHVCPRGSFGNTRTEHCENCMDDCEDCTRAGHCLKCLPNLDPPRYLHKGKCLQECPTGFFAEGGICKSCSKPCSTCEGNSTRCLSCEGPLLVERWECKAVCSEQHFAAGGVCHHCPKMCKECVHGSSCKVCLPPFYLHNGQCLHTCPSGYFADNSHCFHCHETCGKCDGRESDDCTECAEDSYVLYNGKCLEECPDGTYEDAEKACTDCSRTCQTCSSSTSCLSCGEGLLMSDSGHCVMPESCSQTQYYDGQTKRCMTCHRKCLECRGPAEDQCLSCHANWHLLNTTCVRDCPRGYYLDKDQCYTCHRTCETCSGKHSTQCLSCPPSWYKQENECVQTCSTGYYANNVSGTCERCHKSCKECLGPEPTDCLSCDTDFFLLHSTHECQPSCPEYYYADDDRYTCERCHPTCHSCNGEGPFGCTSCVWSYRLVAGSCNSECFIGEYKISENKEHLPICEKCHDSCMQCKGPGPLNCTECHLHMKLYLDENRCVPCCNESELVQTQECCDCRSRPDYCILRIAELSGERKGKAAALIVAISILLILVIGAIVFIWRKSRPKPKPVNQGGYEKLADNSKALSSFKSNHYQRPSYQEDQVIEYKDRDYDDDDDDDDIVYMGQDGTVYRKFKYGLLEDDELDELEYDDESYSFR